MAAKDTVRCNKTDIQDILCADYPLILDKVTQKKLVTQREYNNLNNISGVDVGGHVTRLVDKLMNKGEDTCRGFLDLLQTDEVIISTFPDLKNIQWGHTRPPSTPIQSTDAARYRAPDTTDSPFRNKDVLCQDNRRRNEDEQYQLSSKPTGLCVIINNENFKSGKRKGTNEDAQSLAEVFSWLGFRVLMCKDQTKDQMDRALKSFASLSDISQLNVKEWSDSGFTDLKKPPPQHGDAFICCIMSHGNTGGVSGVDKGLDGALLPINEITSTFNGANCTTLINKPKVFFIQACQGSNIQPRVVASDLEPGASSGPIVYIPMDADFLVAISTVEGYKSYRDKTKGSWFMQSLCQQLRNGCPSGDDLMNILYRVNNDVSQKDGVDEESHPVKQMSEARKVTLRKKLVFSPCYN
ncbi:caspase-8-like [Centroberyx affinis]|uniref:caspase-8-like n=1 Tax=Centroberyx affinis TaxID=166261 RepID=UPI003A5BD4AE